MVGLDTLNISIIWILYSTPSLFPKLFDMSMSSNNREPSSPLDGEGKSKADFESQFLYAVKNNHMVRAERLLKDGNFDPSKDESFIFQWACENGLEPVVRVLMKDERVDVNCKNDICIQLVCELGHVGVLNALVNCIHLFNILVGK